MPTYSYTARDRSGKAITGVQVGEDTDSVRALLRERELYLTSIAAATQRESASGLSQPVWQRRLRGSDMVVFSRQLATLMRSGLPINECLHSVAQQTENPYLREVLDQVRLDILSGGSLGESLARHPRVFSELFVALVRAGEAGGVLEETLETAAEQYDREADMREKVRTAFAYPIVVLITAFVVVSFLVIVVIPQFSQFYASFRAQLPPLTLLLIQISRALLNPWYEVSLLVILLGAVFGFRAWINSPEGRRQWDRLQLNVWLFGDLNRKIAVARMMRALAAMVSAGVPILQALSIAARVGNNRVLSDAMGRVGEMVQQGAQIWRPLEQTGEFPPMVVRMIAAGEELGNLSEMLRELSRFYSRDIDYTIQKMTRLLEPLLTLCVGGVVLFVLLALYLPIFHLTSILRPGH